MAPDDNSGAKPAGPVVLRIKLRYDDLDAMVQRFAPNVGRSGLFLPTRAVQPLGTEVKFELRLANDQPVLVGMGRVKHVRHPDPENPSAAFGIGLELSRVSREGREVIMKMLAHRRELGLPDVAIPIPEDLESARRAEVDTQPRVDAVPIVEPMPVIPSAPLLTSARPGSGPIAFVRDAKSGRVPVPELAPEKARARRPRVEELIDKASELSGSMFATPSELDVHVDVDRVLSRARALAGGDLDVELATLREAAAAPVEISVEAASAELARQLGGKAIGKREKSARWAPPPAVAELRSQIVPEIPADFVAKTRAETEPAPSAAIAAVVDAELKTPPDSSPSLVPDESYVIRRSAEIVAQQDAEYDDAFTASPSTTTAIDPDAKPFETEQDIKTDPSQQPDLMIDDDADISSFERALDAARIHTGVSPVAPERPGDHELDDEPAQLIASGEYRLEDAAGESTLLGTPAQDIADALDAREGFREEEVSDLDVLAEADEEDEDLMNAHGEAEVSGGHAAPKGYFGEPAPAPQDDFAARLDLGDDDEQAPPSDDIDREAAREFDRESREMDAQVPQPIEDDHGYGGAPDYQEPPVHYRYQRARRASSEPSDYTYAEPVSQPSLAFTPHETGEEFDEPHGYAMPAPSPAPDPAPSPGPEPRVLQHGPPASDLESALAALDVGDIDLEHQRRARRPTPGAQRALPGLPPREATGPRPLPGLPIERPRTGPVPVVAKPPTGQQPVAPVAQPARPKAPTGPHRSTAKPPPIPAAARKPTSQVPLVKPATQPVPVVKPAQPVKRPPTDEGVMIDFDEEE